MRGLQASFPLHSRAECKVGSRMPSVHSNACNDVALTSTPPRGGRTGDAACAHLPFDASDVEVSSTPHPPVACVGLGEGTGGSSQKGAREQAYQFDHPQKVLGPQTPNLRIWLIFADSKMNCRPDIEGQSYAPSIKCCEMLRLL